MNNFLTVILISMLISSCSEVRFGNTASLFASEEKSDALLKAKPNSDSDKISDGSEGVPGYLTDPVALSFSREVDQGSVIGSAGAVSPGTLSLRDLVVELWGQAADTTELDKARKISTSSVGADGSFEMKFSLSSQDVRLFITVDRSPGAERLRFMRAGKGKYQAAYRASTASSPGFSGIEVSDGKDERILPAGYLTLKHNGSYTLNGIPKKAMQVDYCILSVGDESTKPAKIENNCKYDTLDKTESGFSVTLALTPGFYFWQVLERDEAGSQLGGSGTSIEIKPGSRLVESVDGHGYDGF